MSSLWYKPTDKYGRVCSWNQQKVMIKILSSYFKVGTFYLTNILNNVLGTSKFGLKLQAIVLK